MSAARRNERGPNRNDHRIKVRAGDAHLLPANRFDDQREDGADEHREGEEDEEKVIDEARTHDADLRMAQARHLSLR